MNTMRHLTFSERLRRKLLGYAGKVRRLSRSLRPENAAPNDAWALGFLNSGEALVYRHMDPRDREHAVRVTRHLLADHPDASPELIAAALLHDSGKSIRPYHVVERVLVGLIPQRLSQLLPHVGALGIRAAHPELGAELLAHAGARLRVAQLVARHHASVGDPEAALLHHYDELE